MQRLLLFRGALTALFSTPNSLRTGQSRSPSLNPITARVLAWQVMPAGRHICLSKALQRRHYAVAEQLLAAGASPDILGSTDLLAGTNFGAEAVAWLLDHTVLKTGERECTAFALHGVASMIQE